MSGLARYEISSSIFQFVPLAENSGAQFDTTAGLQGDKISL